MRKSFKNLLIMTVLFFINITVGSAKEISITFNTGSIDAFSDETIVLNSNEVSGYVTLPSFTDTVTVDTSSYVTKVDDETYYFDDSGYSYSFTGWKIKDSTTYIPSKTVFQPQDVIDYDTLNVNDDATVVLEAVWGRVIYVTNEYQGRYYTDYWIYDRASTTDGRYEKTNAWNYIYEDNVLTLNKGFDVENPLSSLDFAYYIMNYDKIEDFNNAYLNVVMLTGDFDYVKSSSGASTQEHYFTSYATYGNTFTDNGSTLSAFDSTYDDTQNYIWGDYTAQKSTFGYLASSNSNSIGVTFKSVGNNNYNFYWNGLGYSDSMFGSIRFDNVNFGGPPNDTTKRPKLSSPVNVSSETNFRGGKGDYIEFTNRNKPTNYGKYVFRPGTTETVVVNGNTFNSWQTSWSSSIGSLDYSLNWYMGGSCTINADLNLGTAASYSNATSSVKVPINLTVTGGTVKGNIYGGSNSPGNHDYSDRTINIIGDKGSSTLTNPTINGSIYGGGKSGTLQGDTYINIIGSTNIKNSVYGGGYLFSATLFGNSNVTIQNSVIGGNVFGGGYNGNIEEDEDGNGGYIYLNIINSEVDGDVFGVGMGGTQSTSNSITISATDSKYNWRNELFFPSDDFFTSIKDLHYGDYSTDWSWEKPASGFPFIVTDETSLEYGYVCSSAIKYLSWTSNSYSNLTFGRTRTFNYLSLAYARHDVDIEISESTIGTSTNGKGNVYGGGSVAVVYGDVDINIATSTIYGTLYGGGDGTTKPENITLYSPMSEDSYTPPTYTVNADGSVIVSSESVSKLTSLGSFAWSNDEDLLANGGIDYVNKLVWSPNTEGLGSISGNTNLKITDSILYKDIFGGGNSGIVFGNTSVFLDNSELSGSLYGGGNAADVEGNSEITITNNAMIGGSVFGGGNSGHIGLEEENNSTTSIKMVGGTIQGNLYGGGNTSKIFGSTKIAIGSSAVEEENLTASDIVIEGTVFGGGEANASGSENYDFSYVAVTKGTDIVIDGENHDVTIGKSIFGSGNASTTEGDSIITIKNYGSKDDVKQNISIQRAKNVILENSFIELLGTIDSTNKFASEIFTISRVDEFKIKGGSTIYLENGTNLLKNWTSITLDGEKATEDEDNRLYIYQGKNVKVTTSEDASSFGVVTGLTKLGIYQKNENDEILLGIYDYDNPDESVLFESGVYVLGAISQDISVDGFKTNYATSDGVALDIVNPITSGLSHVWQVGANSKEINITLKASSYSTLGKYDISELLASLPETEYSIYDVDFSKLSENVIIINPNEIPSSYENEEDANNTLGLTIKYDTKNGWNSNKSFYLDSREESGYVGDNTFITDYTVQTPSIELYLENASNFTREDSFGTVTVTLYGMKQVSELERTIYQVIINITVDPEKVEKEDYEASITVGKKYEKFGMTSAVINQSSSISVSYNLNNNNNLFENVIGLKRVLISDYVLPENTKITLLDISSSSNPAEYYYRVTEEDVTNEKKEYPFSDFIKMGMIVGENYSDETNYYNDIHVESFIVQVDFEETESNVYDQEHSLYLEARDEYDNVVAKINNETMPMIKYTVTEGEVTYSLEESEITENEVSPKEDVIIDVIAKVNASTFVDTRMLDKKMGLKISLYKEVDGNYEQVIGNDYIGKKYVIDSKDNYPDKDGNVFSKINENVVNLYKEVIMRSEDYGLEEGSYKIKLELINSYTGKIDGKVEASKELEFTVKDEGYGLKVNIEDGSRVINAETGKNLNGSNEIAFDLIYQSNLANPNIRLKVYKKGSNGYDEIDITEITEDSMEVIHTNEYLITENPNRNNEISINIKENIGQGSYKFEFSLYDQDKLIGSYPVQVLIKNKAE